MAKARAGLPRDVLRSVPFLTLLLIVGCFGGGSRNSANTSEIGDEEFGDIRLNPNVRIGEVIWINDAADFAVVQMDSPRGAFEPSFFLVLDSDQGQVSGVLVGGGDVQGRSFGARIIEGIVPVGAEVRIPGAQWTQYLFDRYNQTERLPADSSGAF